MTPGAFAPGWPGIPARWTSSAKTGLGTAIGRDSRVWFTVGHGILNEVYYPRVEEVRLGWGSNLQASRGSSRPVASARDGDQ